MQSVHDHDVHQPDHQLNLPHHHERRPLRRRLSPHIIAEDQDAVYIQDSVFDRVDRVSFTYGACFHVRFDDGECGHE